MSTSITYNNTWQAAYHWDLDGHQSPAAISFGDPVYSAGSTRVIFRLTS